MFLGIGYYLTRQYDKAIETLVEGASRQPDWVGNHIILAAAYAQAGRLDEAAYEARIVSQLDPFFDADRYGTVFRNPAHRAEIADGLYRAGLK